MRQSESIAELAKALVKAQQQLGPAKKTSCNPFFKSKYADLSEVWDACREALQNNGLAVVQAPICSKDGAGVETTLLHTSGEWLSEVLVMPVSKHDAQGVGSCITYARRYALAAFVGVCPEDDDGNAAAESLNSAKKKGLAILRQAVPGGLPELEAAWKTLSQEMRKLCQDELPALKQEASRIGAARQPVTVG